jgi:hypothetical protein
MKIFLTIINNDLPWEQFGIRHGIKVSHVLGKNFEDQLTLDAHKKLEHSSEGESPAGVG